MYYLFAKKEQDLLRYKKEFDRVKQNIERGKTPVWCEIRSAKINLIFLGEYNSLQNTVYWIKEDLYTRGQITGSEANG